MKKQLIILIAILIAIVTCYNFYKTQEIESWANQNTNQNTNQNLNSALLFEKLDQSTAESKGIKFDNGQYECLCQCQLKCPENKTNQTTPTPTQSTKSKKGYRINYYPWYVKL